MMLWGKLFPPAAGTKTNVRLGDTHENPSGISLRGLIAEDFRTHGSRLSAGGFWTLVVHRLGNARMDVKPKPLRAPLTVMYRAAYHGVLAAWGIDLPYNVKVGRRLRIEHHGAVFMGAREIGDDVTIRHFATLGVRRLHDTVLPTIGDRVEIGPGACIVGSVHVGSDSVVCGKSVVLRDVAPGSTIAGIPARRIDFADETTGRRRAGGLPAASADAKAHRGPS